jgi:hypothetical protein
MKKNDSLDVIVKHKTNPFIDETISHIKTKSIYKGNIKDKFVSVDRDTGEERSLQTNIYQPMRVDTQQYVKLYVNNVGRVFNLSKNAEKVFEYVLTLLQKDLDYFYFDHALCMEYTGYKSKQSYYSGLKELIDNRIVAKGSSVNKFWINPTIVFLGDRLVVISDYRRVVKESETIKIDKYENE